MKHKRGDLLSELRHITESQRSRERDLFIHRSIAIVIAVCTWLVYMAFFFNFAPVFPVFTTLGLFLLYRSHKSYVASQNKYDEKLENQLMQFVNSDLVPDGDLKAKYKRLSEMDTMDEDIFYEDEYYHQNSNH